MSTAAAAAPQTIAQALEQDGLEGFNASTWLSKLSSPTEPENSPADPDAEPEEDEPTEPETDPLDVEEDEEEEEEEETEKAPESKAIGKMQKRIDTLTGRAKAAETELAALKTQLAEPVKIDGPAVPLGNISNLKELEAHTKEAEAYLEWLEDNPDGGELGGVEIEPDTIKARLRHVRKVLEKEVPARKAYLEMHAKASAAARTSYPQLFQKDHPAAKYALELLTENPGFANFPDHELLTGDAYVGSLVRSGKLKVVVPGPEKKDKPTDKAAAQKPKAQNIAKPKPTPTQSAKPQAKAPVPREFDSYDALTSYAQSFLRTTSPNHFFYHNIPWPVEQLTP